MSAARLTTPNAITVRHGVHGARVVVAEEVVGELKEVGVTGKSCGSRSGLVHGVIDLALGHAGPLGDLEDRVLATGAARLEVGHQLTPRSEEHTSELQSLVRSS